jgi:hypothetical protein
MATWGFISLLFLPLLISEIFYKKKKKGGGGAENRPLLLGNGASEPAALTRT